MTNEATGIACMVCRREIALVRAGRDISKYECKRCGCVQYCLDRSDGVQVWRKGSNDFNGWVHGMVPA